MRGEPTASGCYGPEDCGDEKTSSARAAVTASWIGAKIPASSAYLDTAPLRMSSSVGPPDSRSRRKLGFVPGGSASIAPTTCAVSSSASGIPRARATSTTSCTARCNNPRHADARHATEERGMWHAERYQAVSSLDAVEKGKDRGSLLGGLSDDRSDRVERITFDAEDREVSVAELVGAIGGRDLHFCRS